MILLNFKFLQYFSFIGSLPCWPYSPEFCFRRQRHHRRGAQWPNRLLRGRRAARRITLCYQSQDGREVREAASQGVLAPKCHTVP